MQWEIVIGLEIHAQLSTRSKIFSGASTAYGAQPNTQACGIDIALPGVLPVLNYGAVERAVKFGVAVGAKINSPSIFARKNYFYPDLPKGYQISQYEIPVVEGGSIKIQVGDAEKTVRLTRAHLEEDAGKSLHEDFHGMSGIDLNRAGTPLLEIVSEPDMRSSTEAVAYAKALHTLVRWTGICDGNMQEGSFRCDANVSVRPRGTETLGTRCEIKNLNSFRFLEKAIDFEARRQIEILEEGGHIRQETRLYDAQRDETRTMRSKEDAHDYRYFPDPDLLPLAISEEWIEQIKASLPELPEVRRHRYIRDFGLTNYDAGVLTSAREMADYFEMTVKQLPMQAKLCANWIMGDVSGRLNKENIEITQCPVSPGQLAGLLLRISDGTISGKSAKDVFESMWQGEQGGDADAIIAAKGLKQISDDSEIERLIDEVLAAFPQQVADYRSGKEKAFNSLVGQVMKATKGKANPGQVNSILKKKLE
ncbi:MAG TPA: Asp-tRNA(Asn)/Glu-tRNA(Gln) amidotransferase subunit GatB [Nitrosomonas nitrosa]|uniref:Asp-tRNA(Asn)/Glu-tRNA(Gln) amidotransferase subunit GatB n=1 Tax=Nitrosomonas nitrosa TaxID=52442 RepID=UPI000D2FE888|nr:Asp-tRNA(Asn)/Glu-tRNA(Gln) amidotransferase subunit GatB [Nitrosomonas nitrosa]MCO6432854.1 Asp-tRNA(Asn)/Glu-tRNA(Gln) amidotransferase subunit GatB [Nitrosomonas nitrosa]HBZ30844.1 Asp-tRNA(Asn)/Glu-tRNA(Gln) amidotransferase subunit GatB [Nitrosomonas nitrosa]HNP50902.1 Asp-tRNA(Asn)/Glu-tRNA(Gln) amidotransferase subunit GatB [Nitrosomonas nitrosa]